MRAFLWTELPRSARLLSNRVNVMDIQHSAFILHAVNMGADKQILVRGSEHRAAAQALSASNALTNIAWVQVHFM